MSILPQTEFDIIWKKLYEFNKDACIIKAYTEWGHAIETVCKNKEEALSFLNMTEEKYQEQLNTNTHREYYTYYEIIPLSKELINDYKDILCKDAIEYAERYLREEIVENATHQINNRILYETENNIVEMISTLQLWAYKKYKIPPYKIQETAEKYIHKEEKKG